MQDLVLFYMTKLLFFFFFRLEIFVSHDDLHFVL
jgi:hypothetical protein